MHQRCRGVAERVEVEPNPVDPDVTAVACEPLGEGMAEPFVRTATFQAGESPWLSNAPLLVDVGE